MHCLSFLLFALERLEIVEATLACDLTLELFQSVEGHSRRIRPGDGEEVCQRRARGVVGWTHS
jgi:hypothetical protein